MALGGAARPLLVPAADVLAKNRRAFDPLDAPRPDGGADASSSSTLLMTIGALTEGDPRARKNVVRFRAAKPDSKPNPIALLFARLFSGAAGAQSGDASRSGDKSSLASSLHMLWPPLEKASAIASRLPDPTVLFLALVLAVLLINRYRPHWFHSILVKIAVILSFLPLFALALLWRKTELFAQLREGRNPLSHPAEHMLDDLEAELKAREDNVKKAQNTLNANRSKLDALRKELAKDPNATDPTAIIVPSRKAAAMIAAGALGAGYDAEAAHAVEARRREESVKKSREEWRQKAEEVENNVGQTEESVKLLQHHASTAYSKRTREIKIRSASGRPSERLRALKRAPFSGLTHRQTADDDGSPVERLSEHTAASQAHSSASNKRWSLFRKKRRRTTASMTNGGVTSLTSTPRITSESAADRP
ncbi:chemotaxis protein CheA [Gracilaria domingensis]|nr:chemotaxis protein CheA [Gracilaria domingensis]